MECPKCKSKLSNDSRFCPRCGEIFEANDINMFSEIYNLKFLEIYYPNKSDRVKIKGVSLMYLFFTYFYAIYKRMYKCAVFSIISLITFFYLLPNFENYAFSYHGFFFYFYYFILIGAFSIYVYYVFSFDRLLLERRKMKINYIIRNNSGKSFDEIKKLVIEDSNDNKIGVLITFLITIILSFLYLFIYVL